MDRIAIVGMACRFPGAANPKAFWELLKNGVDAVREVPADRWSVKSFFDANQTARGKTYARWGGFLDNIDGFDAAFFGISPREAACLDPQQRLMLEMTWEALEDAGQVPEQLAGQQVGVYVGGFTLDYMNLQLGARNRDLITTHTATGSLMTLLSNRISYAFDFRGPSASVDTACSGSMVAVHLACQALKNKECKIAVAGGVNVMCTPEYFIAESKGGFLSPDGRCKSFDSRANGYVRGEGAGAVILKPLADAIADGDAIYAVIRGTSVNQDGRSNGITQPRAEAQEALIRDACRRAGVEPREIQYVEAHGTGTAVGDPIEANALGAVLGEGRAAGRPCIVGSLKTNVGHMEAAAGIAGLIKTSLCLKHGEIPPILHFQKANPKISFEDLNLKVATEHQPWPETAGPRLAGVNSFGFGGTNAHAVLEGPPAVENAARQESDGTAEVLALSAQSADALTEFAQRYSDFLEDEGKQQPLRDICYTANRRRAQHDHRLTVCGRSHGDMAQSLQAFVRGDLASGMFRGRRSGSARPKLAFVLTGMGPQWWGMGRELYSQEPVFREMLQRCEEGFQRLAGWSALGALMADEKNSRMASPMVAQTTNFALQAGLLELWRSWGVVPDAFTGHSAGEPAAAWASGCLTLEDAIRVNYHRSRLIELVAGQGAMMAVQMPVEDAERAIAPYRDRVSIAAENAPMSVTLSGDPAALQQVAAELEGRVMCKMLRVNVAYHSYQLDPLKDEMIQSVTGIAPGPATTPLYSTVTGGRIEGQALDARYWWRNLRNSVNFRETAELMMEDGHTLFVEVGPHPVLAGPIAECLSHRERTGYSFPSLRRGDNEAVTLRGTLGALHAHGYPVDWSRIYPEGSLVSLPAYPWQRERYWMESDESRQCRLGESVHPLLGRKLETPRPCWEIEINRSSVPFVADHAVQGAVVFPGAGYVEMALAAASQLFGRGDYTVENLAFEKALFLAEGASVRVHVGLDRLTGAFTVHRQPESGSGPWVLLASGTVSLAPSIDRPEPLDADAIAPRCGQEIDQPGCYEFFSGQGFQYGPQFRRILSVQRGFQEALATIDTNAEEADQYAIHPVVLDACFQVLIATNPFGGESAAYMPVGIDRVLVRRRPAGVMRCHARLVNRAQQSMSGDIVLCDDRGEVVVEVRGFRVQSIGGAQETAAVANVDRCFFEMEWQPAEVEAEASDPSAERLPWLVFVDGGGCGSALADALRSRGDEAVLVAATTGLGEGIRAAFENAGPVRGVIYLRALDTPALTEMTGEDLERAETCIEVMHLSRAIATSEKPPRLWLVTRGAQRVSGAESRLAPEQAPLWGLGRVIGNQENTAIWGGLVDLDPDAVGNDSELLVSALGYGNHEEVAFRQGQRYVSRLVRRKKTASGLPPRFRGDGAYLITGGLGALGLLTARWMVERGARRLVLMGRSPMPPRSEWRRLPAGHPAAGRVKALLELEGMGVTVRLASVDAANEEELAQFFEAYDREGWPELRGVVHSAGIVRDALLMHMEETTFREVMRPKVAGALSLHRLTAKYPLDFFVMFSSIGSLVVSTGQANYAAGNAFLDSLATYRQLSGLPAMSINWGPWAVGMVKELNLIEHLTARGMAPITAACGMDMMDRLFGRSEAQIAALHADWPAIFDRQPVVPPTILHFGSESAAEGAAEADGAAKVNPLTRILEAPLGERQPLVEGCLIDLSARVLRIERSKIEPEHSLIALGIDSLMAIELKNRIELTLSVTPAVVDILRGLTVRELAQRLLTLIEAAHQPAAEPTAEDLEEAERALAEADPELVNELMATLVNGNGEAQRLAAVAH